MLGGLTAAIVLGVAAACGGGGATSTTGTTGTNATPLAVLTPGPATPKPASAGTCSPGAAASGPVVTATGAHSLDQPDQTIQAGGSVTWTNTSSANHQIVFSGGPDCEVLLINKSYAVTFPTAGTYSYICKIHPTYMKGTITVQ